MAPDHGCTITLSDPRTDADEVVAERVAWANAEQAVVLPDETPTRVEDTIARLRALPARLRQRLFSARDSSGALCGVAFTSVDPEEVDNPELLWVNVQVGADHRRRGLGRELLTRLVDVAIEEGRSTIVGRTTGNVPAGEAFALEMGAEPKSRSHTNRLLVSKTDRAMLERWVADAATRSADYELYGWDGPVADDDMEQWIKVILVMNTAPRDDLPLQDSPVTARDVRENEAMTMAGGMRTRSLIARQSSGASRRWRVEASNWS